MFRLTDAFTRDLLARPESGMGYQFVSATMKGNAVKQGVAYNAELLVLDEEPGLTRFAKAHETLLKEARNAADEVIALKVVDRSSTPRAVFEKAAAAPKAPPASEAAVESTKPHEVFKRFSAFQNDNRVRADRSLVPNTYATTEVDAKLARTGSVAVSRYALPDKRPASYVFTVKPHFPTPLKRGTVAAANGELGGGDEVLFTLGTQPATVTGPDKIADT